VEIKIVSKTDWMEDGDGVVARGKQALGRTTRVDSMHWMNGDCRGCGMYQMVVTKLARCMRSLGFVCNVLWCEGGLWLPDGIP
jgi:hypothetical protein